MNQDDVPTMVECPACRSCTYCRGTSFVLCSVCTKAHELECAWCEQCCVCGGTGLVSVDKRAEWARYREQPYGLHVGAK